MSTQQDNMNSSSLAIASSVLYPHNANESTVLKRRKVKLQTLPGAWIEDNNTEEDEQDKENMQQFVKVASATPPRLPDQITATFATANDEDIEFLKQTIVNLRKEKEKLEETNDIVKKSIQIVARKRMIAQTNSHLKKTQKQQISDAASAIADEEEDIYIVVPSDFMPTQEEMKAAGLDGWEWISAY
ncbi:uncharacterized protein ATC70_002002 [Mucor velutinosus]|uniref:Uncharacterized protein n=1 Tax=Mucor velutinosus TaxID=708070 RepID=A0AAN7DCI7_9FUNG|nr:hypothetical protein ATC70_002002 [Mucor velutinosus]